MKIPVQSHSYTIELTMTPMIDVVFLLLVFFIWTSSFEVPEFDLPSAIAETPQEGSGVDDPLPLTEPFDEMIVRLSRVDAQLIIALNEQPIENLTILRSRLKEIIAIGVQPPVIIDPADEVTMNDAVKAYDAAREAGADRVLFAAQPE